MAVIMKDRASVLGPAYFIQGDTRTQIVYFSVARYRDGIDLAQLAWSVHIKNAAEQEDVAVPHEQPRVFEDRINIEWLVKGIATAAIGYLTFCLRGVGTDSDGEVLRWSSGDEVREVFAAQESEASSEQTAKISELDALIEYVGKELPAVVQAGENAKKAAADAETAAIATNEAIDRANRLADLPDISDPEDQGKVLAVGADENNDPKWVLEKVGGGSGAVSSVNGKTGAVVLTPEDVGAQPKGDYLTEHQDISGKLDASKLPEAVNAALALAKASGEFDGKDGSPGKDGAAGAAGADGVSPTVSVSKSGKVTTISITDKNGTKTATVNDGADGSPGEKGDTGAKGDKGDKGDQGIQGERGPAGEKGEKGDTGATGSQGEKGADGAKGADGVSPTVSVSKSGKVTTISITDKNGTKTATINDGADGSPGEKGDKGDKGDTGATGAAGKDGSNGKDGKTPVKGVDYFTTADQEAIVQQVIAAQNAPDYVVAEAMEVLDKVISAQGNRTFTLAAITDMHYGSSDYIDGVIHACQGMRHISERIKLDAVAVLGDFTDEHQMDTDTAVTDLEEMNALLDPLRSNVNLRIKGNHDNRPNAAAQTYRYIMAYSDATAWGSRIGGYFYRDFEPYKLRVICLNTTEVARDNLSVSVEQYQWFANSLDLSAKEDAAEWGILILSHHPLDWTVTDGKYRFGPILNAYQTGASWTDGAVSCNYAGKNAAILVGNIHGHIHNLLTDKIYIGEPGNSAQTNVWRMATPASRVDYVNHYSGVWVENRWDSKTPGTAEDTAFCVYCIDLDDFVIKAYCYGAGYDRELTYHVAEVPIINLIDTVGYQDNTRVNSSGSHVTENGYTSTNKIPVSTGDVIRTKGVNFDAAEYYRGNIHYWTNDGNQSYIVTNSNDLPWDNADFRVEIDAENNLTITVKSSYPTQITVTGYGSGANLIVTKNQEIK